jgi:hypothetical protein
MGQPTIEAFKMIVSLPHQNARFKTEHGVGEIRGNQEEARRCRRNSNRRKEALPIDAFDAREDTCQSGVPAELTLPISVGDEEKKTLQVGSGLKKKSWDL